MKKIIGILFMVATVSAYAADSKEQAVIEEFFQVSKVKEKYEVGMLAGFDMGAGMADLSALPEEQRKKFETMQNNIKKLMLEEMGWDKVKEDYGKMYLSVYSVAELEEVTTMLKTPIGQKMLANEIKLLPKAMVISQEKTKVLMPKIMQMSMQAMGQ